jgi:predicted DNA-binding protein (MmcQ/YjbR family)
MANNGPPIFDVRGEIMHNERQRSKNEMDMIARVRAICDELPQVDVVVDGFGHTTFKVSKKSFVLVGGGHGQDENGSISIKSDPDTQEALVKRGPYVRTPYIGQHGWITIFGSERIDWSEIEDLVRDGYNLAAPKRLRIR